MLATRAAVLALLIVAAGCGGSAPPPQAPAPDAAAAPSPEPAAAAEPEAEARPAEPSSSDEEWDVTVPRAPTRPLRFSTSEGTWINVDVSPDGRTLVFDLLGDLYTLPIEGGAARRITSGLAFDMQPRWSPDERAIAFISDRDGLNNVWLVDPEGGNPRQVTKESSRDVNSPAWSPDGEYIFVRKHFVARRSLGAGEVWMYHVTGGSGLQVTEKSGWQKDAGEPAISPDGRWLYYSRDTSPGQFFEYNKDVYAGIYSILRRDLATGEESRVTGGPGGAITPMPSPGGETLAFIRRDRLETVLMLRDLETGLERPLFRGLDRDMQEAWAIHGVYAQYDWTPGGDAIVIWAGGRLWRVAVPSGEAREIPFTADVDQVLVDAVRFPVEVHPERFPVRMLANVTTSPDGRRVAYAALGHIWVKDMPDGTPRRLTDAGDDLFEFDPVFSPDGRSIAYTTWSDAHKGRVRVIGINGRGGREVVRRPGHYIEPAWSPDGSRLVYRRTGGDDVRDPAFGEDDGIYIVRADGAGAPELVREGGVAPSFDHTGQRIYVTEYEFVDAFHERTRKLVSTELDGSDEIVHFTSERATEIVPSPDGRWVAFAEAWHLYVMPFPRTGRTVQLGPRVEGVPVAKLARDAGAYIHWSGDSRRIHWALGPEYYTRELDETFGWLRGGRVTLAAERPEAEQPETAGVPIGFSVASDRPGGAIALTNARIITMNGDEVIERGTVVVRDNRIAAVGPAGQVQVPRGAQVTDVAGRTIIPGLIDAHAHVRGPGDGLIAQVNWALLANLAFGVTTAHDPSNDNETVFTNAELLRAGLKLGPRLFSTGRILYGAEAAFKAPIEDYDDALMHIRRQKAIGAVTVKSYNHRRRDNRQMLVEAGRELGVMVVPEGGSLLSFNETMVLDGHTGVEHSLPVANVYDDVARLFGESDVGYTPTMIVGYGGLSGEYFFYERYDVWKHEHLLAFTPRRDLDARSRRRLKAAGDEDFNHIAIARHAKRIQDAGGLVQIGAHGQLQGLGAHWETWMFEQGGMTPLEALRAATINGAKYLGMDGDIGSIEVGKLADLVVLERNPLDDIRNTDSVRLVMLNGRLYDARTLEQLLPTRRPPPVLWWQREGRSN